MNTLSPITNEEKILEVLLATIASCFDAVYHKPEDLPYEDAVLIVKGEINSAAENSSMDQQQKERYYELAKYFLKHWGSFEVTR